jgi:hypothetical protein
MLRCVTSGPVPDPLFRPWQGKGNNGGGFINYRPNDLAAAGAVAAWRQQMREMLGEEGFARWQRSEELSDSPRPLTDTERAVLRRAAAPLLADLAASGLPVPDIREEAHEEREESVCGWIQGPGRTAQGIWVLLDTSPAGQVAQLAEQLQDWAADWLHDAGRPLDWPPCPRHPGAPHRLDPQVRDDRAVWACWESGQVIWPIGELTMPGGARPGSRRDRRP